MRSFAARSGLAGESYDRITAEPAAACWLHVARGALRISHYRSIARALPAEPRASQGWSAQSSLGCELGTRQASGGAWARSVGIGPADGIGILYRYIFVMIVCLLCISILDYI